MLPASSIRRFLGSTDPPTPTVATLTWPLWAAFACLVLTFGFGDLATTALAFSFAPSGHEANPIAAFLLHYGFWSLALFKALILAASYVFARVVLIDGWRFGRRLLTGAVFAAAAFYALVCFSNLLGLVLGDDLLHLILQILSDLF